MSDDSQQLAQQVRDAFEKKTPLSIQGTQSRSFLRYSEHGNKLSTLEHSGIVAYEPTELVITVRAGTSIASVQDTLAEHKQSLAFDPPRFAQSGTIGGTVASGLSGPSRPWMGAVRDHVLGTRIINGKGDIMSFGGQVMKNVAGYDVSRLMCGAFGTLGVILDVSFKVLPIPESSSTLVFEYDAQNAIDHVNEWSAQTVPLNGACWSAGKLYIRLSGTDAGVKTAINTIGGDVYTDNDLLWDELRDQKNSFFNNAGYWRLSLPPATPVLSIEGEWLLDWGGAQRWLKSSEHPDKIRQMTVERGGHAEHWHGKDKNLLRMPLDSIVHRYHKNLKDAFDPAHILNNHALYSDL
ncbi:MAG: glycolate oxidase subunit GlcE [Gammaproteobacteria bacterium]|nr:glycolate oxidase subunit GlcE [Gammaproteobacteria bacterium]